MLLAAAMATPEVHAAQSAQAQCQGGYPMLLLTPLECRTYLGKLKAAQARADHMTVLELQEWHTALLIERSQACPCQTQPAELFGVRWADGKLTFSGKH